MGKSERNAPGKNKEINFEFTKNAFADLVEAIYWYQSQKTNLGSEFAAIQRTSIYNGISPEFQKNK